MKAVQITSRFPGVHGAPVHIGSPEDIGVSDVHTPDLGDPTVFEGRRRAGVLGVWRHASGCGHELEASAHDYSLARAYVCYRCPGRGPGRPVALPGSRPMANSVEDIILARDRRGISQLREHLAPDFCDQAAAFLLESLGSGSSSVVIANGFYILSAGAPETDGPLGAVVIGDALNALGHEVVHVTDRYTAPPHVPPCAAADAA